MLLFVGKMTSFTHNISGNAPRTCIGTNHDGTVVYIITVDGRQSLSRGVTQSELADLALELGCYNAMNLDGGGSTRMMAKTFWGDSLGVVNKPTENRRIINAVSLISSAEQGEATGVHIKSDTEAMLVGDSAEIAYRFYDRYDNAVPSEDEPEWTISGVNGKIENGIFVPSSGGEARISASFNGKESAVEYISVLDSLSGISAPQSISLNIGESYTLAPEVYGKNGEYAFVKNVSLLNPQTGNSSVAALSDGVITAVSEGYSVLSLSHGEATAQILVTVGNPEELPPTLGENTSFDKMRGEILDGSSFSVFSYSALPDTIFGDICVRWGLNKISSSDSYGFLGEYSAALLPKGVRTPILANSFSAIDKGFALVLSLPASGQMSGSDWLAADKAISATKAENIIVLTKTAPNGKTAEETQVFHDYMQKISDNKNVFIVQSGERNGVSQRGKVRYITLADSHGFKGVRNAMENVSVLRFTMDGNECMYDFEKVFNLTE